jgi:hypothetical protein
MSQYVFWMVFFAGGAVALAASVGLGQGIVYAICAAGCLLSSAKVIFQPQRPRPLDSSRQEWAGEGAMAADD